ncbi:MAG TPA: RNA-binding S4 domain-containing protein [Bacteroidales bacterium]|nr:RNA-binding S4 domain-containing protein [Bacteroidales bacterium]
MEEGVRIDKWLWSVRIYKTRSLSTMACKSGKVRIDDHIVKPSREVRIGDIIQVHLPPIRKTLRVLELLEKRVSAKIVTDFMEDLTPAEEYQKLTVNKEAGFEYRDPGTGRPTKRSRREIEILKKYLGR